LKKIKDQKQFLIVGYSFGSLIAIEFVRLLEANNFSGLILIDTAPDQMKLWINQHLTCTSQEELQNIIVLVLLEIYVTIDKKKVSKLKTNYELLI